MTPECDRSVGEGSMDIGGSSDRDLVLAAPTSTSASSVIPAEEFEMYSALLEAELKD